MRIRKLAKELGTDEVSVLALLGRLGHGRYSDPEQQVPAAVEAQLRRHARELPQLGTNALPAPRPAPPPSAHVAPEDAERALFAAAMASVKPLGAPPPRAASAPSRGVTVTPPVRARRPPPRVPPGPKVPPGPRTVKAAPPPPAPAAPAAPAAPVTPPALSFPAAPDLPSPSGEAAALVTAAPPAAPPPVPAPPSSRPAPSVATAPPARPFGPSVRGGPPGRGGPVRPPPPLELQLADARAERDALAARLEALEARALAAEARADALAALALAAEERAAAAHAEAAGLSGAVTALEARLVAATTPPAPSTLRACAERRGLLSDDELAAALRALLDGHRVAELGRLGLAQPEAFEDLLAERVILLSDEEAPPAGTVAVRVPADRSEGKLSSANRAAMSRFSTACLVRNIKRIVIVGGSPVYHRTLRDGLDPRLEVRFVVGNRKGRIGPIPGADLVLLWASTILDHAVSAQFPDGVVIPHRGIARMLAAATEWIEARPD